MLKYYTMSYSNTNNREGLSLIEVVVSTLLVGTVVVGSLSMMGASIRSRDRSHDATKGPLLAESLLAEIMSMPYYDPESGSAANSTNSGELSVTREDFDDVGDFDGWSPTAVQDRFGNPLSEYAGWSRNVQVDWGNQITGDVWSLWDTGAKRILVTVTSPGGTVTTRYGWRAFNGALEQAPPVDRTVVRQIETRISLGTTATTATGTTNLLNHVEDPN